MTSYLIIDDEYIAHTIIQRYCELLPNMVFKKSCYDALEAFEYLSKHKVDLIFLDLNMPKLKGFEFLRTLPFPPKVIVTTAYQEYALEGYELNVVDYLLKPFSFERFLKALNKAVNVPRGSVALQSPHATETPPNARRIFLRSNKKHIQVQIDDIRHLEAAGNYLKINTFQETITIRAKISDVLNTLPKEEFLQVHKSFAVAIKHIKSIEGNQIFIEDQVIPVGKMYKMQVNQLLKS